MKTVAQIDRQIEIARRRRASDKRLIEDLKVERKKVAALPDDPQWDLSTLAVQFRRGGQVYGYAFARTKDGRYYSTGTHAGSYFESWHGLVEWVRGLDAYSVSPLQELILSGKGVTIRG